MKTILSLAALCLFAAPLFAAEPPRVKRPPAVKGYVLAEGRGCAKCGNYCDCFSNIPNGTCGECKGVRLDTLAPAPATKFKDCPECEIAEREYQAKRAAKTAALPPVLTIGGVSHELRSDGVYWPMGTVATAASGPRPTYLPAVSSGCPTCPKR